MTMLSLSQPPWTALCRIHSRQIRISVSQPDGTALLQARLPVPPVHPRALLELLEALARHSGSRLVAVISVDARSTNTFGDFHWEDDLLLGPSALVHVVVAAPRGRQLRLAPSAWRVR